MLLQLIVLQFFYMPDLVHAMSNLLLKLPFSRRYVLLLGSIFGADADKIMKGYGVHTDMIVQTVM